MVLTYSTDITKWSFAMATAAINNSDSDRELSTALTSCRRRERSTALTSCRRSGPWHRINKSSFKTVLCHEQQQRSASTRSHGIATTTLTVIPSLRHSKNTQSPQPPPPATAISPSKVLTEPAIHTRAAIPATSTAIATPRLTPAAPRLP